MSEMTNHVKSERMIYQIDETREKILEKAEEMLITEGLFATTMSHLAKAVGISRTSLYRYFRDKLDLSLAILVIRMRDIARYEELSKEVEHLPDGISRIEMYMKRRWLDREHNNSYRFFAEFDAYYSGSRIQEGFREKMEEAMVPYYDYPLENFIVEGQEDGSIRRDLSVKHLHEILMNGVRSFHQRLILRGKILVEFKEEEDLDVVMDEFLRIMIDGIRSR
ncbi:MAG: helix-turn-helix domain containing protein [Spirochaetales bacterium]|nr:helix-turn-helix domain containing protein [Spirochaetales bacterium]